MYRRDDGRGELHACDANSIQRFDPKRSSVHSHDVADVRPATQLPEHESTHGRERVLIDVQAELEVHLRREHEPVDLGFAARQQADAREAAGRELPDDGLPEADPVVLPKDRVTDPDEVRGALQRIMSADCGVVRDADGLQIATETLADLAKLADDLPARTIASYEVIDLLRVSRAIVASATQRTESRGSHTRVEYPEPIDSLLGRFVSRGSSEPVFVALPGVVARGHR